MPDFKPLELDACTIFVEFMPRLSFVLSVYCLAKWVFLASDPAPLRHAQLGIIPALYQHQDSVEVRDINQL